MYDPEIYRQQIAEYPYNPYILDGDIQSGETKLSYGCTLSNHNSRDKQRFDTIAMKKTTVLYSIPVFLICYIYIDNNELY